MTHIATQQRHKGTHETGESQRYKAGRTGQRMSGPPLSFPFFPSASSLSSFLFAVDSTASVPQDLRDRVATLTLKTRINGKLSDVTLSDVCVCVCFVVFLRCVPAFGTEQLGG